jgi:uncharacterized membrane protein
MAQQDAASARNVRSVAEIERQAFDRRTAFERATDAIVAFAGHEAFIIGHIVWFAGWVALNTTDLSGRPPFDPFPFSLLTLIVSLEAILLSSFLLRSQTRMAREADLREHLDLQINLLAEQEATAMLRMLRALCRAQGVQVEQADRVDELLEKVDVRALAEDVRRAAPSVKDD